MDDILTIPAEARPFIRAAQADRDMTCRQMAILMLVSDHPGRSNKAIARTLGVSAPIVTRTADKLIELKLIRRRTSFLDRRMVELSTTPAGERLLREMAGG